MRYIHYFAASLAISILPAFAMPTASATTASLSRTAGITRIATSRPGLSPQDPNFPIPMPDFNVPDEPIKPKDPTPTQALPIETDSVTVIPVPDFNTYYNHIDPIFPIPTHMPDDDSATEDQEYVNSRQLRQLVPGQIPSPEEELLNEGEYSPHLTPGIVIMDGKPTPVPPQDPETPEDPETTASAMLPATNLTSRADIESTFKGYIDRCDVCLMRGEDKLWCVCRSTKGQPDTIINKVECEANLSKRLGNSDGKLVWSSLGYRDSCRTFALRKGRYFYAECPNKEGVWKDTMIDLNEHIGIYDDGHEMSLQLA
ncbi:hypothetical protein PgNI_10813 [Pyricularia grisea]|uniref:Cyanovirin-N domain-containing protein n=1 Tax=Pyricularia grisea TaxID=148305 RepID=A0A6P8AYM9_PYRGI|nr:hypothetical protein PgNI_10813 [Pyricularia grisea]TLD07399.1 hypothetical protein PgNI_10813 [Pyricularia grisea]